MTQPMTLTVLGCGSSSGAPVIGCDCAVCVSTDKKNNRRRTSAHIAMGDISILIDTGPDMREQVLRAGIKDVDAVLYTHAHADHLNGIDDLRGFCFRRKNGIAIYANSVTLENISTRFDYAFLPPSKHWNRPVLQPNLLVEGENTVLGVSVHAYTLPHGRWTSVAYRIGNIAWVTDVSDLDDRTLSGLKGLDCLFLDCLMDKAYPSHLSVEKAFEFAQIINAKQTYFIHMTHNLEYHEFLSRCPENTAPAFDGLQVHSL